MSAVAALQQAMVRLMLDPTWRATLEAGPVPELNERERRLLLAVDPRAWSVDPLRTTRLVQALIEEYPLTTAVLGVHVLGNFFASPAFADCLAGHGSMALAFGAWAPRHVSGLEHAIARARRLERAPGTGFVTRPGVEPFLAEAGLLAFYTSVLADLGPDPLHALAHGRRSPPPPKPQGPPEPLLVRNDAGQLGISRIHVGLFSLLEFTLRPRTRRELDRWLQAEGLDAIEARDLLRDLCAEGLLDER